MPSAKGVVSAMLLAVAGVAFAPAFVEASNELNFGAMQYGTELEVAVGQLPLVVALLGLLVLAVALTD
jgi:hypothetical protein